VVLVGSLVGAVLLVMSVARLRRLAIIGLLVGSLTALSGTAAFTIATAATPHTGSIPTSGPTGSAIGGAGGFGSAGGFGGPGGFGGRRDGSGAAAGGTTAQGALPDDLAEALESGQIPAAIAEALESGELPTGAAPGGFGGGAPGGATTVNSELVALLNATTTRWSAAVTSAQSAAGYILATDTAVMGIGGFTGSDPSPTLAQFQAYVTAGDISYFIAGGAGDRGFGGGFGGGGPGGSTGSGSEIQAWVEANFTATTVGGTTVYDLTSSGSS
jgi:hypothetical protein